MIRKLIWAAVGLVVILLIALGVTLLYLDSIARQGIERGATYALGVPTHLEKAGLSLLNGVLTLDSLQIDNPKDFDSKHYFTTVKNFDIQVVPSSVFSNVVEVPHVIIDGLEVYIDEANGTTNASVISQNLRRLSSGKTPDTAPPRPEEGPKVRIKTFKILNLTAHIQSLPIAGGLSIPAPVTVKVPEIVINDMTPENGQGLAIAEVTKRIVPIVLAAIVQNGGNLIPGDLKNMLNADIAANFRNLGADGGKLIGQLGGQISGQLGTQLKGVAGELGKGLGGVTDGVGGIIGGVLGGDKKPADPKAPSTPADPSNPANNTKPPADNNPLKNLGGLLGGDKK